MLRTCKSVRTVTSEVLVYLPVQFIDAFDHFRQLACVTCPSSYRCTSASKINTHEQLRGGAGAVQSVGNGHSAGAHRAVGRTRPVRSAWAKADPHVSDWPAVAIHQRRQSCDRDDRAHHSRRRQRQWGTVQPSPTGGRKCGILSDQQGSPASAIARAELPQSSLPATMSRHFCSRASSCVRCSSSTAVQLYKQGLHCPDGCTRYSQYWSGPISSHVTAHRDFNFRTSVSDRPHGDRICAKSLSATTDSRRRTAFVSHLSCAIDGQEAPRRRTPRRTIRT
eukprot:SAG31_NODE_1514_length_8042_cov_6.955936_7_plen_279_part_00